MTKMMDDLISRQAAIEAIGKDIMGGLNYKSILKRLPSAQRKGKWIVSPKTQDGYCSECQCDMPVMMDDWGYKSIATNFCPNCGARMEVNNESTLP